METIEENNANNVYCNDLIHVVCLPFNITAAKGALQVCL